MTKKPNFSDLRRDDDSLAMTEAIDRFQDACLEVYRPSPHQLKIGGINFYPSTGTVQIDGQSKQKATGIEEVFRVLEKADPAMKYLKKPKCRPEHRDRRDTLMTIELEDRE